MAAPIILKENEILTLDQMDQIMIAEYEANKKAILESNIPAWISQDPSIF
jgi:hypothetical protein